MLGYQPCPSMTHARRLTLYCQTAEQFLSRRSIEPGPPFVASYFQTGSREDFPMATALSSRARIALLQRAERQHLQHQIRALHALDPLTYPDAREFWHGGGADDASAGTLTIRSLPAFGGKLNRSVFFGGGGASGGKAAGAEAVKGNGKGTREVEEEEEEEEWETKLRELERFYRTGQSTSAGLETGVQLWVSEFALCDERDGGENVLRRVLRRAGYERIMGVEHFYHDLGRAEGEDGEVEVDREGLQGTGDGGIFVSTLQGQKAIARFFALSVRGFESKGRAPWFLRVLAEMAVRRDDTLLFQAEVDGGEVAGTAAMAVLHDLQAAYLYLDSTVPEFRRRGVHAALLRERVEVARRMGCEVVVASVNEGSASARSFARNGFQSGFRSEVFEKAVGG
nr:hypothetical protein CFP56_16936 [Quercus suber]POE94705.1 hypothetical protein CFP56_16942 [Quercus suber]